jgi:3',5'-cyclic AMP phosphodiesterase CpdA
LPVWKFVQISDPHFAAQSDGCGSNLLIHSQVPDILACLREDLQSIDPDFILATGDLAAYDSRDAIYAARDMLDSIGIRYYPIGGNQDFQGPRSRAWFIEAHHAHLPVPETVYSFNHKNLHIAVLDPWWIWKDGTLCPHREEANSGFKWAIPPHQFDWLKEDLKAHRSMPTIVAMHYPAVPIPERLQWERMLKRECLENGALLCGFLRNYPQVVAVLTGHAHMHYVVQDSRVAHVTTASLSEYPIEYRIVEVDDDRLTIRTQGLSDQTFAARSLLPEGEGSAGHNCDRDFVLSFNKG